MAGSTLIRIYVEIDLERRGVDGRLTSSEMSALQMHQALWTGRLSLGGLAPGVLADGDSTRRQAFVVAAEAPVAVSLPVHSQADYDWDGASPPGYVELEDYPNGVFKPSHADDILVFDLCMMTTKLESDATLSLGGDWAFVDGELETSMPYYDGTNP